MAYDNKVLDEICRILADSDVSQEPEAVAESLNLIFEKYADHRLLSRDAMPTATDLLEGLSQVSQHLESIAELFVENIHLAVWLDEFAKDNPANETELSGRFSNSLLPCLRAARAARDHFEKAIARDEPLVLNQNERRVEHRRRTRTESRDTVLIPYLVGWLHLSGLQFQEADGRWGLDLDAACEIIDMILTSQGIPVPASGETAKGGEAQQGRLRILVKHAWKKLFESEIDK